MKNSILLAVISVALYACKDKTDEKGHNHSLTNMETRISSSHIGYLDSLQKGIITEDTLKGSPTRVAMNTIGKSHVHITYQSPGVKGRVIWGGLVPYNAVWVTGAHSASSVMFMEPVEIDGKQIEKGTYAIFTIPGENEWVLILNKNFKQHLTDDYKESEDVLRLNVEPLKNEFTPRLTYSVDVVNENEGKIVIAWNTLKVEMPIKSIVK